MLYVTEDLGNVSKACKIMRYHRDTFYEVRRAFQAGGVAALVEERRGPPNPHPNRVSHEIAAEVLAYALERPTYRAQRVASELRLKGPTVSAGGVRGVWLRHDTVKRQTWYITIEEIQRDPDHLMQWYNLGRSHQGYRLQGRTPAHALREALDVAELPPLILVQNSMLDDAAGSATGDPSVG